MFFPIKKFDEFVAETKSFGEFLTPYSYPKTSQQTEYDIDFLKAKETVVDGYTVVVYYSRLDLDTHYSEIVQITGRYAPFLPFSLVCKIGKKFLGDRHLVYVDFMQDNRRVYYWTVATDKEGNPISEDFKNDFKWDDCIYEGLSYTCLIRKL